MNSIVSVFEKKEFLRWFLNNYELKRRECTWLLNFLLSEDAIMKRVHFVEKAELCPKALIISATCVEDIPFYFYKKKRLVLDVEIAFHDIRLNSEEHLFIQLNFHESMLQPKFVNVLEDNPFLPVSKESELFNELIAEMFLDKMVREGRQNMLRQAIDEALDRGDKERFSKLTEQLREENL